MKQDHSRLSRRSALRSAGAAGLLGLGAARRPLPARGPRGRHRRRLWRRHLRQVRAAAFGPADRRGAGRARGEHSSPARSRTWCWAAAGSWPTSRCPTATCRAAMACGWSGIGCAIDPARRTVRLASGARLPYDKLVVSPASSCCWDGIGACARPTSGQVLQAWKAGPKPSRCAANSKRCRTAGLRDRDPRGAVPLPARPVRARLPGRRYFRRPSRAARC